MNLVSMLGRVGLVSALVVGCSAAGSAPFGRSSGPGGSGAESNGGGGAGLDGRGAGGATLLDTGNSGGSDSSPLSVSVQQSSVPIDVVTVACAGQCADLSAVATGGNAPYSYQWDDGSTNATRHVCPNADATYSVAVTDTAISGGEFPHPAETARAQVTAKPSSCIEVIPTVDAGAACEIGSASSFATDQSLDLFGQITYFDNGASLPAGRYRVTYVDGCMKYDFIFGWSIQTATTGTTPGAGGWYLVGDTTSDVVAVPPGSSAAFANFDDCVAASASLAPVDFTFNGGKLGVWLSDSPYEDNVAGENGRNPKWKLQRLDGQCGS